MEYQLINGDIIHESEARIPLTDLGLLRAYSVFDFFRVLNSTPVFLDDHVARLINSAADLGIEIPWTHEEIADMCKRLIEANNARNAGLRIVVTGGYAPDGYNPTSPNIYMLLHALPGYDPGIYQRGAHIITDRYERDMPAAKTTMYAHVIRMRAKLKETNAAEVLYWDDSGISECSRSNIFFVDEEGSIHTPDKGMLRGITRKHALELAKQHFDVTERVIQFDEIPTFKEVFITSSTKGILPITTIDDLTIGDGKVGPVSQRMLELFGELIREVSGEDTRRQAQP